MNKTYDVRTRHRNSYYLAVIRGLLSGIKAEMSVKGIAQHLNSLGLFAATGASWTVSSVAQALHKLRHSNERSSHLHNAMMVLAFDGLLTKAECLPLIQGYDHPQMRM